MESGHFSVWIYLVLHVLICACFLVMYFIGDPDLSFFNFVGALCQAILIINDIRLIIKKKKEAVTFLY